MPSNTLEGFPSVPCERALFLARKNTGFLINSCHKTAAAIDKSDKYDDGVLLSFLLS